MLWSEEAHPETRRAFTSFPKAALRPQPPASLPATLVNTQ